MWSTTKEREENTKKADRLGTLNIQPKCTSAPF